MAAISAQKAEVTTADVETFDALATRMQRRTLALHILEMQVAGSVDELGRAVAELLTVLLEAHNQVGECECSNCSERSADIDALLVRALGEIQFEDRVRQMLNGVRKALHMATEEEEYLAELRAGGPEDGRPHLDLAIFDTYVTEGQRRVHRGEGGEAPDEHTDSTTANGLVLF